MNIRRQALTLALAATLSLQTGAAVEPPAPNALRPFSATYHLSRAGIPFGEVRVTLALSDGGEYRYHAHTLPRGPVTLFRDDEITEESTGRILENEVRPDNYRYRHEHTENGRDAALAFDHANGQVVNRIRGTRWRMPVPPGVQDKFSQQLALMQRMLLGAEDLEFPVADGGRLKSYRYERIGNQVIESPAGSLETVALARRKDDHPSQMTVWLAPELGFLPVMVERRASDDRFTMLLQSVTWAP